jgi:hypothetical protein
VNFSWFGPRLAARAHRGGGAAAHGVLEGAVMKRMVRLLLLGGALAGLGACRISSTSSSEGHAAHGSRQLRRGEYLVGVLGCDDCHTPKKMTEQGPMPDMEKRLVGHVDDRSLPPPPELPPGPWCVATTMGLTAWSGPWGVSYAINLTPDEDTGIGIWTEEMFVKAMRTGKHMGQSRPILPPMPWSDYAKLNDEDLKAVFAYLRSLPAMTNRVPDPIILPPPGAPGAAPDGEPAAGGL